MNSEHDLKKLRDEIQAIDSALLDLVAKRQALSRRIAEAKLAAHLPIKDYRVEKQRIEESRQRARELGLYEEAAEEITKTLIKYSCLVQEEYQGQARARSAGSRRAIAIVGGQGRMGRWLAEFFEACGHSVSLLDTHESADPVFPALSSLAEAAAADIVVLATPITATAALLEKLIGLKPRGLVFDVCSLKTPLLSVISKARRAGMRITSVHPMFGPRTEALAGRNVVLCEAGDPRATEEAAALFGESSAGLVRVPLERHDAYMGYVLGLSHLTNLVFGAAISRSGLAYDELRRIGSTTFYSQAQVTEPVVAENPDLYFEIQAENGTTPSVLTGMADAFESYTSAIRKRDRDAFRKLMDQSRHYFELR